MEQKSETLYIPVNIITRLELFAGYGIKELVSTIISTLIAGVISLGLYAINKNLTLAILFTLITCSFTVMATIKDKNNLSVVDQLKYLIEFIRGQKKYKYIYGKEWF